MKKILRYTAAFALATAALISASYATATTDNSRESNVERNVESPSSRWRIVKQVFRLRIPQNNSPLSQLIIDTPSTVAVSNDIDVRDENGQKININIYTNGKKIIIDFPDRNLVNTRLLIELNKVRQPIHGSASIYRFSVKVVGSDTEISIGEARFITF
ncbi:hypothetical protein NIES2119_17685 [[Phormidium ambiguum] IAM M-71]|uniref:DUF2808 domain-containing protein n=1 Tax=[Phormidium ambiguum] IAM M-71 TaxID=454136 RepID=A0A1U7IGF2_9CYAN|nr:hypothetical protein [Phormidium ambiguum]OKH36153.1 hypothetical protein NIES2119_17685 [Phormidium ambiguum IAM M-71]